MLKIGLTNFSVKSSSRQKLHKNQSHKMKKFQRKLARHDAQIDFTKFFLKKFQKKDMFNKSHKSISWIFIRYTKPSPNLLKNLILIVATFTSTYLLSKYIKETVLLQFDETFSNFAQKSWSQSSVISTLWDSMQVLN